MAKASVKVVNDGKVVLDKADLPLPELEDELLPDEEGAERETGHDEDADIPVIIEDVEETEVKRRLPSKKVLIAGGAGILLLLLLLAIWFLFLKSPAAPPLEQTKSPAAVAVPAGPPRGNLDPFMVPIMVNPRGRMLLVTVMFEFAANEEKAIVLEENVVAVRDVVFRALRNRSVEDLNSARMNNALQTQIKDQINQLMGGAIIKNVYFPEFTFVG